MKDKVKNELSMVKQKVNVGTNAGFGICTYTILKVADT
jgi:hypothetical protein